MDLRKVPDEEKVTLCRKYTIHIGCSYSEFNLLLNLISVVLPFGVSLFIVCHNSYLNFDVIMLYLCKNTMLNCTWTLNANSYVPLNKI